MFFYIFICFCVSVFLCILWLFFYVLIRFRSFIFVSVFRADVSRHCLAHYVLCCDVFTQFFYHSRASAPASNCPAMLVVETAKAPKSAQDIVPLCLGHRYIHRAILAV